ncbi:hypothetical protein BC829DRAFT_9257 [Chytridium lagenaria]|nr:hypothetical protein BC829DRAFT_9257 [Chytridium lagenaria]
MMSGGMAYQVLFLYLLGYRLFYPRYFLFHSMFLFFIYCYMRCCPFRFTTILIDASRLFSAYVLRWIFLLKRTFYCVLLFHSPFFASGLDLPLFL